MRIIVLFVLLASLFVLPVGASSQQIYLLKLETSINPVTKDYVVRNIAQAEREGAGALIIQLDTPGGLESSMKEIIKAIFASEVPIIVWVGPSGSRAASAGVFITMAGDVAAMATGTNIGAAHPVGLGGESPEEQSPMEEKILNDAAAFARSVAEKRGRNVEWAEEAVRKSVSITSSDALKLGVIDLIADDLNELLERLDGYPLGAREALAAVRRIDIEGDQAGELEDLTDQFKDTIRSGGAEEALQAAAKVKGKLMELEQVIPPEEKDLLQEINKAEVELQRFIASGRVLRTEGAALREFPMTLKDRLLNYLADPNVVYLLLMLGIYGLIYEFFNPGIGFGLVAGGISLLLAFMGLQILPINITGLTLILFGALLMVLDAFTPTHGILTTGGVISLLLGSFTLFNIQSPTLHLSVWNIITTTGVVTGLFVFIIGKGLLIQRKRATTGLEGMIGVVGEAREDLAPEGLVFVKGEYWKAVSVDGALVKKGEEVLVEGVDRGRLLVRKQK
jgi:membrane-bound serine protease (ClpP class)